MDEEDPKTYQMRISYARPPQQGPGSQRLPPHVRRDQVPPRRAPPGEQRRDAHPRQADGSRGRPGVFFEEDLWPCKHAHARCLKQGVHALLSFTGLLEKKS